MRLKRFFLIFTLLLCTLFFWKLFTIKVFNVSMLNIAIQDDTLLKNIQDSPNQTINVKTDVIDVKINLYDGNICQGRLLNYQEKLKCFKKLDLIKNNSYGQQIISGLLCNKKNVFNYSKNILYKSDCNKFRLLNNQKILTVPIILDIKNNIHIIKIFTFKKGSYEIGIKYQVYNNSQYPGLYHIYGGLKQKYFNKTSQRDIFENLAYSSDHKNYKQYSLNMLDNATQIHYISKNGWFALLKKYFSIAWFLDKLKKNDVYILRNDNQDLVIFYKTSGFTIFPKQYFIHKSILWLGPKIQNKMSCIAPYFDFTIDYGWFWFLSKPLFNFLYVLHYFLNNWGYAIIFITCIIRIITYPLTKSQYLATLKMKLLQPEINHIKRKFKDNRKKLNEKILQLYRKNKVHPFSGLFPVLFQMPIFLALYYMLVNAIELRHAPFIFWINDLSAPDPFYILPFIMGITIFFMQKTAPVNYFPLSLKEKIINFSPVFFIVFFLWFPSGLVLYYTVSNIVTILQQMIIHNKFKFNKMYKLR